MCWLWSGSHAANLARLFAFAVSHSESDTQTYDKGPMMGGLDRQFNRRGAAAARRNRKLVPEMLSMEERQLLSVFTVTNTSGDPGVAGSLPWAVSQANYKSPGLDYINFNIPGKGPFIIDINQTLYLNEQVVVNGLSQPGYNGSPLITVRGNSTVPSIFLLQLASSGSTIQGLAMSEYFGNAVTIFPGSNSNWIQNNWMGFYYDASNQVHLNSAHFDNTAGVGVQSNYNSIRMNTISGTYNGVIMLSGDAAGNWGGAVYTGNAIQYNRIGTDPTGSTAAGFGNAHSGIFFGAGAQGNYIGPGNVISGNSIIGVEFLHTKTVGNVVFGNFIGTNSTGAYAIPNGVGVLIANGSQGNAVGGSWGANLISGNTRGGVALGNPDYPGASGNWVVSNIFGLNVSQTAIIPGQDNAIGIQSGVSWTSVQYNVIAGSINNGIVVSDSTSNYIANNFIGRSTSGTAFANGAFGVAFLPKANWNWLVGNQYGSNRFGRAYVDPAAVGNVLTDLTSSARTSSIKAKARAKSLVARS
jgi:hypothetical protein